MDPPGTKLSQHTTKRRYQAISRLQGELLHAYGRGKPSRENFVPHTGPPPGQNSPHTKPRRAKPVQNSPSRQPRWTHPGQNSPNTPQNGDTKPFLACRENFFTPTAEASRAGRTLYRTQDHLRDKTLPAQHISRRNGTKFSLLVIKRSFWPVLRMQGEFYPGNDIRGHQQGEFYPGILVTHGPHPGSTMTSHVFLARQHP